MSKEYIEREAARKVICNACGIYDDCLGEDRDGLDKIPTADVVEVVRCQDCISSEKVTLDNGHEMCYCVQLRGNFGLSHFCSWGERDGGVNDGKAD